VYLGHCYTAIMFDLIRDIVMDIVNSHDIV